MLLIEKELYGSTCDMISSVECTEVSQRAIFERTARHARSRMQGWNCRQRLSPHTEPTPFGICFLKVLILSSIQKKPAKINVTAIES